MEEHTTESLARKLGIVERVVITKSYRGLKADKSEPPRHVIALKFQTTAPRQDQPSPGAEIIDFAAVASSLKMGSIVATFHQYVTPTEDATLSSSCVESTGVTQEMVDNGVPLKTCMMLYANWLLKLEKDIGLKLPSKSGNKNPVTIPVTWSDLDLGMYLPSEARRKKISYEDHLSNWVDLRNIYVKCYNEQPKSLRTAVGSLKLKWRTRNKNSLKYATNIANLAIAMHERGHALAYTSSV